MTVYNSLFSMQDLFLNSDMKDVLPQFSDMKLKNVYSYAVVEKRVQKYVADMLGGKVVGDGEIVVKGKHPNILKKVEDMKELIENLFNNTSALVKNIRSGRKLYLPYATLGQIKELKTVAAKKKLLQHILDNINYNPDFNSGNRIMSISPLSFENRQKRWKTRVKYTE